MIAFVWFTCPKDYAVLAQSVASVRALESECRIVTVISNGDPCPEIAVDQTIWTDFDRGFHLNGIAATLGVADTLAKVARSVADLIVKIDSDMRITEPFWRHGGCVHKRHNGTYMGLYCIPAAIARQLPELIKGQASKHHEAITISKAALAASDSMRTIEMDDFKPPYVSWIRENQILTN